MFSVFRKRSFSLLWSAQLISTLGDGLTTLVAAIYVFRLTGSALSVGLMLMATAVPTLFVGLVAGVFVDRYDRKRIMWLSHLIRAVLVATIPFTVQYGVHWLYITVAVMAGIGQFFDPAHDSVLPELASDEELSAANSFIAISTAGSHAIGFALAGLLASAFPLAWAFYIDAGTYLVSALLIFGITVPKLGNDEAASVGMVVRNLRQGFDYLYRNEILRSLVIVFVLAATFIGMLNVLTLPFTERVLQASEFVYGVQEGLVMAGFVAASFFMAAFAPRLRDVQWIAVGLVGMAVVSLVYAFSTVITSALVLMTLMGMFNAIYVIPGRVIRQRYTDRELRGRVNAVFIVILQTFALVGMALAGLADLIDIRYAYAAAALGTLGVAVMTGFLPAMRQPAAEWRRAYALLKGARLAPGMGLARAATVDDLRALAQHEPVLARLDDAALLDLASRTLVGEAPEGTTIVKQGDQSTAGYFIIEGRAAAGRDQDGDRPLETLEAGAFFGEIAALTSVPRTANVVAVEPTKVLEVPADTLRSMTADPELNRLFMNRMTERLARMGMIELPKVNRLDQSDMRDLRSPAPSQPPEAA